MRKQLFRRILLKMDAGVPLGGWLFLVFRYCLFIYYAHRSLSPLCFKMNEKRLAVTSSTGKACTEEVNL